MLKAQGVEQVRRILCLGTLSVVLMVVLAVPAWAQGTSTEEVDTGDPETKEDCKKGGYETYGFKNQGQCIASIQKDKDEKDEDEKVCVKHYAGKSGKYNYIYISKQGYENGHKKHNDEIVDDQDCKKSKEYKKGKDEDKDKDEDKKVCVKHYAGKSGKYNYIYISKQGYENGHKKHDDEIVDDEDCKKKDEDKQNESKKNDVQ